MFNNKLYRKIIDQVNDAVSFVDRNGVIRIWNNQATSITGYTESEMLGTHCFNTLIKFTEDSSNKFSSAGRFISYSMLEGGYVEGSGFICSKYGKIISICYKTIPIYKGEEIDGALKIFSTENKEDGKIVHSNIFKEIAYVDYLTKVPNRRYIEKKLNSYFEEVKHKNLGIVFFDIDDFKGVNDTYGHGVGDEVLIMISNTFRMNKRDNDVIGRWGGDEFVGIFPNVSEKEFRKMLERFHYSIGRIRININNEILKVTVSSGGALVSTKDTAITLLRRADCSLLNIKKNGKNNFEISKTIDV